MIKIKGKSKPLRVAYTLGWSIDEIFWYLPVNFYYNKITSRISYKFIMSLNEERFMLFSGKTKFLTIYSVIIL